LQTGPFVAYFGWPIRASFKDLGEVARPAIIEPLMHHLTNPAVLSDLLASWGYLGIFIFVFVGNLGVPVPEESVLITAGFLAGHGLLDLEWVYVVAVASAVAGDCSGFMIGRTGGQHLLERLAARFVYVRQRIAQLRLFFDQHGSKAVFMARFITGARFLAGPMAGAAGMPFLRFLGWNVMGALVWCSLMVTIGYLLGDEVWRAVQLVHWSVRWIALAVALVALAAYLIHWWTHQTAAGPDAQA
jgi:membrane protein DedA with SNARE-associated domain